MFKRSNVASRSAMTDARESDTFILVLGQTGAGKSTFINAAIGKNVTPVGHGLTPRTRNIHFFPISHPEEPSRRVIFVDTPGFDDTHVEDAETLDRILEWLALSFNSKIRSARIGIVYLHEITQQRGEVNQAGMTPRRLCTPGIKGKVVLATTKWRELLEVQGQRRLRQLKEKYARNIDVAEFRDTQTSAWATINPILGLDPVNLANFQKDLAQVLPRAPPKAVTKGFFSFLFRRHK